MDIILFVFVFFIYRCILSFSGKKTALWFKEAPTSLNFLSKCNVKKCVHGGKRKVQQSKVNGEYNVRQF